MNILHVLDISIPNLSGYSSRSRYIINNQANIGLKPFVITCERQPSNNDVDIYDEIKYFRTHPNVLRKLKIIPVMREFIEIQNLKSNILKILENYEIDIVHAHSPCIWGMAALTAARKRKIPIIYEIRAFWEDAATDAGKYSANSLKYKIVKKLETRLAQNVDHVITISKNLKNDMISRGISTEKITVLPNGVDLQKFKHLPKNNNIIEKYKLKDSFVMGFIGSFFDFEGLDLLLKAMSKVQQSIKNTRLMLVGGGEKEVHLKQMAKSLGLNSQVIFTGKVAHEEVANYYSVIDLLIYPRKSKRITELVTPLKPLEAMGMKKCVILSDVGGHKELVADDNCAVFFKNEDIDDLAMKIMSLIKKPANIHFIGDAASEYIKKEKMWSTVVQSYLPIYERVLG